MMMVDTNVLIDLREDDPVWKDWSFNAVAEARLTGDVVASAVTIGELAARSGTFDDLQRLSYGLGVKIVPLSPAGAYHAGRAQRSYRAAGGKRRSCSPTS